MATTTAPSGSATATSADATPRQRLQRRFERGRVELEDIAALGQRERSDDRRRVGPGQLRHVGPRQPERGRAGDEREQEAGRQHPEQARGPRRRDDAEGSPEPPLPDPARPTDPGGSPPPALREVDGPTRPRIARPSTASVGRAGVAGRLVLDACVPFIGRAPDDRRDFERKPLIRGSSGAHRGRSAAVSRRRARAAWRSSARSRMRRHTAVKSRPASDGIVGNRLIGVKPGMVLISDT